jgi:hypothetical protein
MCVYDLALRVSAVAHIKLRQEAQARDAVPILLTVEPGLTVSGFFARIPVPRPGMAKTYADSSSGAGLPQ